jgi:flagellar basal-body rod modification protein FlgD
MTTNPIIGAAQTPAQTQQQASTAKVAEALTSTDTFLTLLVAQLKNQDPLKPADSTAFVTQLATFSGVEQSTQMRDDLDAIRTTLTAAAASAATAATAVASGSTSSTTSPNKTTGSTASN